MDSLTIGSITDKSTGAWENKEFTAAEAYELYTQCIYPDMLDGTIGLLDVGNAYTYHTYYYANEIEIWLYTVEDAAEPEAMDGPNEKSTAEQRFYTYPTPDSKRTNAWLQAHGVVLSDLVG